MRQKIRHALILQFYQSFCDTTGALFVGFYQRYPTLQLSGLNIVYF
jgi:hypothetical protein